MKKQPSPVVFFLDTTHGKLIRDLFRDVGIQLMTHRTFSWPGDMLDELWIAECGMRNLVILSGDKRIETVPEERQAVITAKAKVFMFDDNHETATADWCAAFLVARDRIFEIAQKADGPFFVTIKPCRVRGHISQPRFEFGGQWRPAEAIPPEPVVIPEPARKKLQQSEFDFSPSDQGV